MRIVIEIDGKSYKEICLFAVSNAEIAIKNGIVLPKGHGMPSVQLPQNIIRCKECRFYTNFQKGKPWNVSKKYCNRVVTIKTSPDDFCSFAKTKIIDKQKAERET